MGPPRTKSVEPISHYLFLNKENNKIRYHIFIYFSIHSSKKFPDVNGFCTSVSVKKLFTFHVINYLS